MNVNKAEHNFGEVLAIIPARGGSKGIMKKNLFPFCGKPLIAWAIEKALQAKYVNRVVVSTDDNEISELSIAYGAEVVMRPAEISGDFNPSEEALMHTLDHLNKMEKYEPDWLVFLQCTSPLLTADNIDAAFVIVSANGHDSIFSAYEQHFMGRWNQLDNGTMKPINYDPKRRLMRQEAQTEYIENGALYIFRPKSLLQNGTRFGEHCGVYVMPAENSYQIDKKEDICLLEKLFYGRNGNNSARSVTDFYTKRIKLIIVDFDGTMTDNRVIVNEEGGEQVVCNRSDGWGVRLLKNAGIDVICLSSEKNPVVVQRCAKLDIDCVNGVIDKGKEIERLLTVRNVTPEQTAFVGNDINDIPALDAVGLPIVVQDAHDEAKKHAKLILKKCGGQGALLEVAELFPQRENIVPRPEDCHERNLTSYIETGGKNVK